MKIVFMGTPDFAVDSLRALVEAPEHEVLAVYTQPDRPRGRGQKIVMTAVKEYAVSQGLPVEQPEKVRAPEVLAHLQELAPDIIVVAAFGQFLPASILELPRYGCVNVHASLLPKYRGAAPIHYAILEGEAVSGVTIMQMNIGMDEGDILEQRAVPIPQTMTMGELHDELKVVGAELLLEVLTKLEQKAIVPQPQNPAEVTYAHLLERSMEKLSWESSAQELHDKVRAFNPWPGAYTTLPSGKTAKLKRTKVLAQESKGTPGEVLAISKEGFVVATGKDCLEVLELQPESKKVMPAAVFCNGRGVVVGDILK